MFLQKLIVTNFKNYESQEISFSEGINFITGNNGSGKTNLLDALHYLSLTKSAFMSQDVQTIKHGESFFVVNGIIKADNEQFQILCSLEQGQKKSFKVNKKPYDRLSEHIGRFPLVLITPYDTDLIREGSEGRRKFIDSNISQIHSSYLQELIRYNEALRCRNILLKQFSDSRKPDYDLLDIYSKNLLHSGRLIYKWRQEFTKEFVPLFIKHYQNLTEGRELPAIVYSSKLEEYNFEQGFQDALQKDLALQRTTLGIHKDDFIFTLDNHSLKNYGSQGQQKSFVIALKLAQYEIIKKSKSIKPFLLLDDIFDKLDGVRIKKLMAMVAENTFGQLFITDARAERIKKFLDPTKTKITIFHIENGNLAEVND
ncbi:MAG TPA: DNA replication and repair protein RecF [Cytophagaceae bacterium]|jgi:DNA replication and repair protein RecF